MKILEMVKLVKSNLDEDVSDLMIADIINNILVYCNLDDELDIKIEPFIRKKIKQILSCECQNINPLIESLKEGDSSVSFKNSEDIVALNENDKSFLNRFRKVRR